MRKTSRELCTRKDLKTNVVRRRKRMLQALLRVVVAVEAGHVAAARLLQVMARTTPLGVLLASMLTSHPSQRNTDLSLLLLLLEPRSRTSSICTSQPPSWS